MASRRSSEKSYKRNFIFTCFHLVFWNNSSGTGHDTTAPHVQVQFHPINRTRCQAVSGFAMSSTKRGWDWCPLIFLHCFEEREQIRITSHCVLDCKPVAHINQSPFINQYAPFIDNGKKVSPFDSKSYHSKPNPVRQSRSSGRYLWIPCNRNRGLCLQNGKTRGLGGSWVEDFFSRGILI